MTAYFCPDCEVTPVPAPRRGKDGRCDWCRSQVGQRSRRRQGPDLPMRPDRITAALDATASTNSREQGDHR